MLGKKADGGLTAIVIILIIIVFLGWLIHIGQRECYNDGDCKEGSYCGSDFGCHKIPVIEKVTSPVVVQRDYYSLTGPAIVLGFAIIIAALILRFKRNKKEKPNISTPQPGPYLSRFTKPQRSMPLHKEKIYLTLIIILTIASLLVALIFLIFLFNL